MKTHFEIVIIGGGTAGIMTAAQLIRKGVTSVAIIEPSKTHYYQPAWTLVGAGTYSYKKTAKPMKSVVPKKATWIQDYASKLIPEKNSVETQSSGTLTYDYLVVAPGLVYDFSLVEGLEDAIDKGVVCSNYTDPEHTWQVIQNFKGGTALFTQPTTPIKCGGAPQKIMYLAESHFKKSGVRKNTKVVFATAGTVIFGVKPIAETLMKVVNRKDINLRFGYQLKKIDGKKNIAWYGLADHQAEHNSKDIKTKKDGKLIGIHFDMLHTAPPSVAPKFIQDSPLASEAKWMAVNHQTLQNETHKNVYGLGDVAALPTAKTGAAIRKQVPIVVDNILQSIKTNTIGTMTYDGYSSCPLVTDYGKMVLAEFDYANNFTPDPKLKRLLIKDSSKEHWRLWMLKKHMLPYLYWNKMLKGKNV
ncbi:NAD(P)/FAD-dependent oxidoreductase [Flavobacteriaceae bacterium]|nr:NAD(P)/FAD-dependent oxidoreductase [Flavobacteriaceae bacterium]MDC3354196.1 NAD(P)/FAD-dependent oxidoreductase [Flavobacteriaceae bacterium]